MALNDSAGLLLRIRGDSSDAVAALNKVKKEAGDLKPGLDGLGSSLGGLVNPAAIVTAGLTAIAAAAVSGGLALFQLAKNTAAYGSEIFNASVKTGLTTETISALKLASERTGVSMESLGTIISRFSRLVGEAEQGSDKAAETLKRLGITPKEAIADLDGALATVFQRIQALPDPISKATLAQQAFGKAGTELLKVIDDFNGDLPGAIEKARELGLVMSEEDARAADEFGDQMDTLNAQLAKVGRTIGKEVIPPFLEMAKSMSDFLKENPGQVKEWGETFAYVLRRVAAGIREAAVNWEEFQDKPASSETADLLAFQERIRRRDVIRQEIKNVIEGRDIRTPSGSAFSQIDELRTPQPFAPAPALIDYDAIKKQQEEAQKAAEEAQKKAEDLRKRQLAGQLGQIEAIQEAEQRALDKITAANKAAFEARAITAKEYIDQRLADEENYAKGALEDIEREYELRRKQEKLSSEQLKALQIEEDNERQRVVDTRLEREAQAKKEAAEQTKKLAKEELEEIRAAMERRIALHEATGDKIYALAVENAEKDGKTANDLAKLKEAIEERTTAYRIDQLTKYAAKVEKGTKEQLNLENQIKILEQKLEEQRAKNRTADEKRNQDFLAELAAIVAAEEEHWQQEEERENIRRQREAEDREQRLKDAEQAARDEHPFFTAIFDGLDDATGNIEDFDDVISQLGHTAEQVFLQMGQGLGNMVQQWVLLGDQANVSMSKMVAATLAGVAAQATTLAIFHLAMGIAALTPWGAALYGPAPLHFKAAALWGVVAVGAALAGRAIAGNSFQQQTATSSFGQQTNQSGQGSGEGQGERFSGQEDVTVESGRNAPSIRTELVLKIDDREGWFTKMFRASIENNSGIRADIRGVAEG